MLEDLLQYLIDQLKGNALFENRVWLDGTAEKNAASPIVTLRASPPVPTHVSGGVTALSTVRIVIVARAPVEKTAEVLTWKGAIDTLCNTMPATQTTHTAIRGSRRMTEILTPAPERIAAVGAETADLWFIGGGDYEFTYHKI